MRFRPSSPSEPMHCFRSPLGNLMSTFMSGLTHANVALAYTRLINSLRSPALMAACPPTGARVKEC